MKVESWLFTAGVFFFAPIAVIYGIVTRWKEPLGPAGLLMTSGLCLLIALYFWVTSRRIDARPEDDPQGEIYQGAGAQGEFAPYSWWPLWTAAAAAISFAGLAVGWWLFLIGIGAAALSVVGWVFEFYRGAHAH